MPSHLLASFSRVTRQTPCPRCDKSDWCLIGRPGTEFEGAILCTRTESPHKFGEAGWLHRPDGSRRPGGNRPPVVLPLSRSTPGNETMARIAERAKRSISSESLRSLGRRVQLSPPSLTRLDVGEISLQVAEESGISWAANIWTFPMRNARGQITGIRLRKRDGTKLTWPGGREGLFIPASIDPAGQLLVCEGTTDTAAALDFGFSAIGRPSCSGGRREVIEYVRLHKPACVVVVADQDVPGRTGAVELARALVVDAQDIRLISPPEGIKDLRAWLIAGATSEHVSAAIDAAEPLRISFRRREGGAS